MSELSPKDKMLLVGLRKGAHFKANPANVYDLICDDDHREADACARRLIAAGMVRKVEKPGSGFWLRITDAGMAEADVALDAERSPTLRERLQAVPIGKGVWDMIKIGLGAVLGVLAVKYFGV
ncbi:MAG TPA: hypothetical protein VMN38_02445 [Sphingomicrobium sp.]|nr:hypothetical protein [Sphingomicrobium sp.]